jgi:glycerol-3-phosphate dehydrogenase
LPDAADIQRQIEGLSAWTGVTSERLKVLFERYGTRAEAVATFINGDTDRPLNTLPDYSLREILFIVEREKAFHLDDFVLRRSMLAMLGRLSRESLDEIIDVFAKALDWTDGQKGTEMTRTLSILDKHGVALKQAEGVRL